MSENVPNIGPMKIQIRKGLGITHALKELVEKQKMELSDGKITAKEWNSVLDKLIEIQQTRQANGKSSIFGGGTDKTRAGWHNSFVVHPNQEIEFTAEEAAELYEAIGAKFTKNSAPVTETTPPAAPAPTAPADTTETTPPAAPAPTAPADTTETTPPAAPAPTAPADTTETTPPAAPAPTAPADSTETTPPAAPAPTAPADTTGTTPPAAPAPTAPADSTGTTPPATPAPTAPADSTGTTPPAAPAPTAPAAEETDLVNGGTAGPNDTRIINGKYYSNGKEVEEKYARGQEYKFESDYSARVWEDGQIATFRSKDGKVLKPQEFAEQAPEEYLFVIGAQLVEAGGKNIGGVDISSSVNSKGEKCIDFKIDNKIIRAQIPVSIKTVLSKFGIEPKNTPAAAPKTELPEGVTEEKRTEESGNEYTAQIKDGKEIKRDYGRYYVTVEYDEKGIKTRELETYDSSDKIQYERLYDADGNMTKITERRKDGTIANIRESQNGREVKDTYYKKDGKTVNSAYAYEYDSDGNESKMTYTRGDGTIANIRESQNGREVKDTYYEGDGKTVSETFAYEYDSDGNESKKTETRGDGTIHNIKESENGKTVKSTYYEKDGKTVSKAYAYEYDADGNKTKETETRGDGTIANIRESQNGREVKDTYYEEDGKTVSKAYAYEYDSDGNESKKTETRGDGTIANIRESQNGRIVKSTYYEEDGKTVNSAYAYEYNSDGNESKMTRTRSDGTVANIRERQNDRVVKDTYYSVDGKTVNRVYAYEYDADGKQAKETFTRGDGTTEYEIKYDEYGKEEAKLTYMADGKTRKQQLFYGKLEYQKITSPNKTTYWYNYNNDEVCVFSELAEALKDQISGASLNSNTIALLKQITPENVIKVLTSYKNTAQESLEDAIKAEWGMGQEEIDEYINKALAARKETLKIKDDENLTLEELAKRDVEYTKKHNE